MEVIEAKSEEDEAIESDKGALRVVEKLVESTIKQREQDLLMTLPAANDQENTSSELVVVLENENEIKVNAEDEVLSFEKFRERLEMYSSACAKEDLTPAVKLYIDPRVSTEHTMNIINALSKSGIIEIRLAKNKP